jgi:hypothetical protein
LEENRDLVDEYDLVEKWWEDKEVQRVAREERMAARRLLDLGELDEEVGGIKITPSLTCYIEERSNTRIGGGGSASPRGSQVFRISRDSCISRFSV